MSKQNISLKKIIMFAIAFYLGYFIIEIFK